MYLVVILALFGAALGAFLRPRPLAVAFAGGLSASLRPALLFVAHLTGQGDDAPTWAGAVERLMESPFASYLVLIAAGVGACLFAALLCLMFEEKPSRPFWMPQEGDVRRRDRTGRFVRATDMIEERAIHNHAEARVRAAFNG
ncbi:MAG: hypothetical protein JSR86_00945 [Proteobacteria bacterium]|nr:hypothetical protein [Pseudomonadota bacterium]